LWRDFGDALQIDGARPLHCMYILQAMARSALVTVFLAAFGRAIAEVGAIMIVGGTIRGHTRTMTTSIALETSKGDLAVALGLGGILVMLTLFVSASVFYMERHQTPR
jgi:tungstate transport system permease protein